MGHDERGQGGDQASQSVYRTTVRPEWIDYNGHMNVAFYGLVFDQAADVALAALGLGEAYRQQNGCSVFVRESHLVFDREVGVGAELAVHNRVIDSDDRRLVLFQELHAGEGKSTVATNEVLCVHVELSTRRSRPWPAAARSAVADAQQAHIGTGRPARAGRSIGLRRSRL